MNILISINDKYLFPAMVMLKSFYIHNMGEHNVFLLHSGLNKDSIKKLRRLSIKNNSVLIPIFVDQDRFSGFPLGNHFTKEIYFRLLAHILLPKDVDRVLWLDSDIVVDKSIYDLYKTDFDGYSLCACRACSSTENNARIGLKNDTVYFNSGVILFNLIQLRNQISEIDVFDCLEKHKEILLWPDQDALNILYEGKTIILDYQKYNLQVYNKSRLSDVDACIIHFVGSIKPWSRGYISNADRFFFKYSRLINPFWTSYMTALHTVNRARKVLLKQ